MAAREPALFSPIRVGKLQLLHRIVHAPLTRRRGTRETAVPLLPIVAEYYSQRASKPGTLLITEATTVAPEGAGVLHVPGIYSDEQVAAWGEVRESSFIGLVDVAERRESNRSRKPFMRKSAIFSLSFVPTAVQQIRRLSRL